MSPRAERIVSLIAIMVGAIAILYGIQSCAENDCKARGGHLEPVIGGRGGYVCEGATK